MKNTCLKIVTILVFAWLSLRTSALGEMFYGPTSATNHLHIAANSGIVIDSILTGNLYTEGIPTWGINGSLISSNTVYYIPLEALLGENSRPVVSTIAGPSELVLTNASAIYFTRLTNSSIATIFWDGHSTNIDISVPKGKTIEFIGPLWLGQFGPVALRVGGRIFYGNILRGHRFDGPAIISIGFSYLGLVEGIVCPPMVLGSYRFIENSFDAGIVVNQGNPIITDQGSPITVERSDDLKNWESVALFDAGLAPNVHYRLSIKR
jgi:hypothetical protein